MSETNINLPMELLHSIQYGLIPGTICTKNINPYPGDLLNLYVGFDTHKSQLLKQVVCESVSDITIFKNIGVIEQIVVDRMLTVEEVECLANKVGFVDSQQMIEAVEELHGLPFSGHLISWFIQPLVLTVN